MNSGKLLHSAAVVTKNDVIKKNDRIKARVNVHTRYAKLNFLWYTMHGVSHFYKNQENKICNRDISWHTTRKCISYDVNIAHNGKVGTFSLHRMLPKVKIRYFRN